MFTPLRPAVFPCAGRRRYGKEPDRSLTSPPYPAWPEVAVPSTFYTFPTLCSSPTITMALYCPWDSYWGWEEPVTLRNYLLMTSEHEAHLPQIVDILSANSSVTSSVQAFWKVSAQLLSGQKVLQTQIREIIQRTRAKGSGYPEWDAFAYLHDLGHYGAWSLDVHFINPAPVHCGVDNV